MSSTLGTQNCPVHAYFEVGCMICTTGNSFPVHMDTQMSGTMNLSTSNYPRIVNPAMPSAYRDLKGDIQAPVANILCPNLARTDMRFNTITNSWYDPRVEGAHDFYPEQFALSREEKPQMFAGKHSYNYRALSPVNETLLSPVRKRKAPGIMPKAAGSSSSDRASMTQSRPFASYVWQDGKIIKRIGTRAKERIKEKAEKMARERASNFEEVRMLAKADRPQERPTRLGEKAIKPEERLRSRNQRTCGVPSLELGDLNALSEDEEGPVTRSMTRKQATPTYPPRRSQRSHPPVNYSELE